MNQLQIETPLCTWPIAQNQARFSDNTQFDKSRRFVKFSLPNDIIGHGLDTIFLISRPNFSHISSTIVREIIRGGGDAGPLLPPEVVVGNGAV